MNNSSNEIQQLRAAGAALQHKWRSKPKGDQLRRHLEEIERRRDEPAVEALVEFLVRMQLISDSVLLRDVLDAAEAMLPDPPRFDIRPIPTPANKGVYFHIGPGLEMHELTAEESAEMVALGPQHGSGDDCAICAVLARQRRDRAARAGN